MVQSSSKAIGTEYYCILDGYKFDSSKDSFIQNNSRLILVSSSWTHENLQAVGSQLLQIFLIFYYHFDLISKRGNVNIGSM